MQDEYTDADLPEAVLTDEQKKSIFEQSMMEQIQAYARQMTSKIKWTTYRNRRAHENKLKAANRKRNKQARQSRKQQRTS